MSLQAQAYPSSFVSMNIRELCSINVTEGTSAAHLDERQDALREGVDLQLVHGGGDHGGGALPLAAALHHRQEGLPGERRQPRDRREPANYRVQGLRCTNNILKRRCCYRKRLEGVQHAAQSTGCEPDYSTVNQAHDFGTVECAAK